MEQIIPFIIPLVSFVLQAYPRLFNRFFGVDVWTRLIETRHVRDAGHNIPREKIEGQFIVDGYFDYPPVFPFILSFIPTEKLKTLQGFIAPLFDAIQIAVIYYAVMYLVGDIRFALLAQTIYMLTPMIAIENSYMTPRSLGYMNFTLVVLPLLVYHHIGNQNFLWIGLFFAVWIFLTHRFATQAFLFISLFFTFYLDTALFIQAFLIGFAFATLITNGYYLRVLKGHLSNIYFWVCNLDYRWAHQVRGLPKKNKKVEQDWVGKVNTFMSVFSPIALFGLNPWALSAFITIAAWYYGWFNVSPLFLTFAAWILFFYVFGSAVLKIKQLMPIGEGQRYMEMATVPAAILSANIFFEIFSTPWQGAAVLVLAIGLIGNLGLILFIQMKGIIKDRNRSITDDMWNVFDYVNSVKGKMRIICVPHQNTTMTVYHTNKPVFVNADNPGLLRIQEVYPILRLSLKELKEKYDLTHALVKESFATLEELDLKKKDIVYQSGDVMVVKI